jgi:uncharacterized membrane protein YcjF (UPF0283 family)
MTAPGGPDPRVEYLYANRHAYTREALTRQLVEAGHDQAAVEAAWALVEEAARPRQSWGSMLVELLAVLFGGLVVVAYGGAVLLALWAAAYSGSSSMFSVHPGVMLVYSGALVVVGVIVLRSLLRVPRQRRRAAAFLGTAIVAVVAFAGLSGLCLVALDAVA